MKACLVSQEVGGIRGGGIGTYVVEAGRRHGLSTPVNEVLVDIANRITEGELQPDPANLARALTAIGQ